MKIEESTHHHRGSHAGREDLAGEYKYGDAGQLIFMIIFLAVWILDSFVFNWSTFLTENVTWYIITIPGLLILIISGLMARSGLKMVFGEKRETPHVITKGVFSIVRHPVYLAAILLYLGLIVLTLSLISAGIWIMIIIFYWAISRFEEKLLLNKFGKEYEEYMQKVPMLFPIKFKSK